METARISEPRVGHVMTNRTSAAVESAVDAYATRVLKEMSPPEACIDESLGPYVTSLLRCSDDEGDVTLIPEFESLCELLEEHCSLTSGSATTALTTIATAVRTGVVPEPMKPRRNVGVEMAYQMNPDELFSVVGDDPIAFPTLSEAANGEKGLEGTPLKPDRLIPFDLLGVLDDPSTPVTKQMEEVEGANMTENEKEEEAFPPLCVSVSTKKNSFPKSKMASTKEAEDLAAVLFRSSRPRQSSIDSHTESKSSMQCAEPYYPDNQFFHQQWDATVEMLLSVNPDLSEEAAVEAALIANADFNAAQFIIQEAFQAPPICRHMLNDHCYRSDCQFSHDVEGHTCLFWMRGRCGKGASCRFLHGFSDKAVEGLQGQETNISPGATSKPVAIATTNLVSHNMNAAFSAPQHESSLFSSFRSSSVRSSLSGFECASYSIPSHTQTDNFLSSSWGNPSALEAAMNSFHVHENQETTNADGGVSFASIASKGYDGASFTPDDSSKNSVALRGSAPSKIVKIPQDLWNAHINRDSQVFHIPDPMKRYALVSASVKRSDVIDLHYQSTKTFAVVLANVLPEKLQHHGQVWVVTGTGHHVGRSTHQKGGGALESAVLSWLSSEGYDFCRGCDRNGHGGAVLVKAL